MSNEFNHEDYLDVLQNIESALVNVYEQQEDMIDANAENAVQALIRSYEREANGRDPGIPNLRGPSLEAYQAVREMLEWRMGREALLTEEGMDIEIDDPITLEESVACLKRIRRSIRMWNKEGGRRGYYNYVSQFIHPPGSI